MVVWLSARANTDRSINQFVKVFAGYGCCMDGYIVSASLRELHIFGIYPLILCIASGRIMLNIFNFAHLCCAKTQRERDDRERAARR